MTEENLKALLIETEKAHAASGHPASEWADWYAKYMLPRINEMVGSAIKRMFDGPAT